MKIYATVINYGSKEPLTMQKRKNNMKTKDFILFFFVSRGGTTKRLVWVVLCIPVRWGCGDYRETPGVSPGAGITGVTDFKKNKKKNFFQKTLEKWFFKKIQLLAVREKYARAGIHRKKNTECAGILSRGAFGSYSTCYVRIYTFYMLSAIFRWNFSGRTVRGPTRNYLPRRRPPQAPKAPRNPVLDP